MGDIKHTPDARDVYHACSTPCGSITGMRETILNARRRRRDDDATAASRGVVVDA